jgi:hypothetical protein
VCLILMPLGISTWILTYGIYVSCKLISIILMRTLLRCNNGRQLSLAKNFSTVVIIIVEIFLNDHLRLFSTWWRYRKAFLDD